MATEKESNMTWPGQDHSLSCSLWDVNEVFRVQLFEKEDEMPKVAMLGEYVTTHREFLTQAQNLDGSEKRVQLKTPEGEALTNTNGIPTVVRIGVQFERIEHQANLTVLIEEGKNIKKLGETGPINAFCVLRSHRGQEFKTKVIMNSNAPQWNAEFSFGLGPTITDLNLSVFLVEDDRSITELGGCTLPMDRLLTKVCSQQDPFSNWYVFRSPVDFKSRGSVRLKFTYNEIVKIENPAATRYTLFPQDLSGVRQGRGTHFQPRFKFKILKYNLYFGVCRYCKEPEKLHSSDGKCIVRNSTNQERVLNVTCSSDGVLIAWGTDHGKICLVSTSTADQLAVWHAHNGPVIDLQFSPDNKKLLSVGEDIHEVQIEGADEIDQTAKNLPRKHSVLLWALEDWVKARMKRRAVVRASPE